MTRRLTSTEDEKQGAKMQERPHTVYDQSYSKSESMEERKVWNN